MITLFRSTSVQDNASWALSALLSLCKTNPNQTALLAELTRHPYYPSLLSISDVLNLNGYKNVATRITLTELVTITTPFLAHLHTHCGVFALVLQVSSDTIHYRINDKTVKESLTEFEKKWTGVVLLSEDVKLPSGIITSKLKQALTILTITIIFAITLSVTIQYSSITLPYYITLGVLFLAGWTISAILVLQSVDRNNPLVHKLCNASVKKNDCNNLLDTKAAKLTSWLSLSDVGLIYYSGTLMLWLFSGMAESIYFLQAISLLATPFVFYSVFYQWVIAKTWCKLCLAIQVLIVLHAISTILFFVPLNWQFTVGDIQVMSLFALPGIFWLLLKPKVANYLQYKAANRQLTKFKYNVDVFKQALYAQPLLQPVTNNMSITLGNEDADNELLIISNPFCGPCKKAHEVIVHWLKHNDELKIKLLLVFILEENDDKYRFARHVFNIRKQQPHLVQEALNSWYATRFTDLSAWIEAYPVNYLTEVEQDLQKVFNWVEEAKINATPSYLVNGRLLPEQYTLHDIKYILPNL